MSEAPQRRKMVLVGVGCAVLAVVALAFFLIGKSASSKSSAVAAPGNIPSGPVSSSKGTNGSNGSPTSAHAKGATTVAQAPASAGNSGLQTVKALGLPPEARVTLKLIDSNGPYPYSRDGVVYSNFEKILPKQPKGYYHEYTVVTPGSKDRGARRIIAGEKGERFYTDDHYASFKEVVG